MDSRSSSSLSRWQRAPAVVLAAALALATLLAGCGRHAVRPSQKTLLSDRVMQFDDDPRGAAAERRVETSHEGSAGQDDGGSAACP